ncbi:uncharacterized protein LOC115776952 isoform X1 [Archocentrus centrarchus]|uniref:uncharacterized protein LOC115776952 isoform X1 n=2 Tax=Archocentrus centrarchus TaxID=63155 RepID=UPI0011E9C0E3|nr:uncharacterized protein LOC115776952 isoform X1 [Archocentrus centrarchus]
MNRKTLPVSNSTLRRRARVDVENRLKQMRDDATNLIDFQMTTERNLDHGHISEEHFHESHTGTDNPHCLDTETGAGFSEQDGMEIDLGLSEDFEDAACDVQTQTSESDHFDDELQDSVSLSDSLSHWAIQFRISLVALTALLAILRIYHSDIPKDARTLLRTETEYSILERAGGQYHYFGILASLRNTLLKFKHTLADSFTLKLQINIDGLPLFKSSCLQLWPILGLLLSVPMKEPVVIGLFCGPKKPSSAKDFLEDFVTELQQLENGFDLEGKQLNLKLHTVICDTPARSFIKNTKNHNAYHGCDKCVQPGNYINRRMTYPCADYALRTDESFTNMADESHHHEGPHPFIGSSVRMVSQFPLDYMHLVCLGVVRRMLHIWLRGPLNFRLPASIVERMSAKLLEMRSFIPVEFARKPRSLRELDRWKATEFRQFLLYTGPVMLGTFLDQNMYYNFMLLFSGVAILVSPRLSCHTQYARTLLKCFVSHFGEIYGKDQIVYNVHGLVHLAGDVQLHGCLDSFSAFPYENYLHKLKKLIRKPEFPLAQIIRRLSEIRIMEAPLSCTSFKKPHYVGPIIGGLSVKAQYGEMTCDKWTVKVSTGDNVFVIGNDICCIHNIVECSDGVYVVYKEFSDKSLFFDYPFNSDYLNIYKISQTSDSFKCVKVSELVVKCTVLPHRDGFVAIPMFHAF